MAADLHHDSDTAQMSPPDANLRFDTGQSGNVEDALNAAH